jgi:hypothetical protein
MSCEDDQSECYELFESIKAKNVLSESDVASVDELFDEFSELYEADRSVRGVLDDIALTLLEYIKLHNLTNIQLGWYVAEFK